MRDRIILLRLQKAFCRANCRGKRPHLVYPDLQPVQRGQEVATAICERDGHRMDFAVRRGDCAAHCLMPGHPAAARRLHQGYIYFHPL